MGDYYVRELAQREEMLKEKVRALRKCKIPTKMKQSFKNWKKSKRRSGRHTGIVLGEAVAVGVAVDVAKNASLLLEETWESGTAPLGAGAARTFEDYSDRAYLLTLSRTYLLREEKVNPVDSAPKSSKLRKIMGRK
ncbi:hypothetical protein N7530_012371 [Penicillium desertorum]|uniref:Uncharacterized protein n=1 Tax=Penicillium desertorum TaxID=1303715 RepID=A0A9W9WFE5_9EURO|nr:hypothetical protein N7530_012371 [Penicillium desertorum]